MKKPINHGGFSLFEICVVLIVISILVFSGYRYYLDVIESSKYALIKHQAATFSRTVESLYSQAKLFGKNQIEQQGVIIYFNEKGWPSSAFESSSAKSYNQTPQECQRLWQGIFSNAPSTAIVLPGASVMQNIQVDFWVYSLNGRICRYEIARKQEGRYFFDYDLKTGEVTVFSPGELKSSGQ